MVRSCCVFDKVNNRLALFYIGKADKKEITQTMQQKIPRFMIPTFMKDLPEFPLTKNGKIDRKALLQVSEAEKGVTSNV